MVKVFEVRLVPRDASNIHWIVVTMHATDMNACMKQLDETLPQYRIEKVIELL